MADCKWQQVIDAIKARMQTVTAVNNYSFTPSSVDVQRVRSYEEHELPAIAINDPDADISVDGVGAGKRDNEMPVQIAVVFAGLDSSSSVRNGIADIIAAIGTDETFGELLFDCRVDNRSGITVVGTAAEKALFAQITLSVKYRSTKWVI